jgi:hypothetical protein
MRCVRATPALLLAARFGEIWEVEGKRLGVPESICTKKTVTGKGWGA